MLEEIIKNSSKSMALVKIIDYFLTNKTKELTDYKPTEIVNFTEEFVVASDDFIDDLNKINELLNKKLFTKDFKIAGGSVVNLLQKNDSINDFDVFVAGYNLKELRSFLNKSVAHEVKYTCPKGRLLVVKLEGSFFVDFIFNEAKKPLEIINKFDFLQSQAYIENIKDNKVQVFYKTKSKELMLASVSDGALGERGIFSSILRLYKYEKKGFIVNENLKKYMYNIAIDVAERVKNAKEIQDLAKKTKNLAKKTKDLAKQVEVEKQGDLWLLYSQHNKKTFSFLQQNGFIID